MNRSLSLVLFAAFVPFAGNAQDFPGDNTLLMQRSLVSEDNPTPIQYFNVDDKPLSPYIEIYHYEYDQMGFNIPHLSDLKADEVKDLAQLSKSFYATKKDKSLYNQNAMIHVDAMRNKEVVRKIEASLPTIYKKYPKIHTIVFGHEDYINSPNNQYDDGVLSIDVFHDTHRLDSLAAGNWVDFPQGDRKVETLDFRGNGNDPNGRDLTVSLEPVFDGLGLSDPHSGRQIGDDSTYSVRITNADGLSEAPVLFRKFGDSPLVLQCGGCSNEGRAGHIQVKAPEGFPVDKAIAIDTQSPDAEEESQNQNPQKTFFNLNLNIAK